MNCRHCGSTLEYTFLDLGFAPPSNAYLKEEDLTSPETYFPLKIKVCDKCWLAQTEDYSEANKLFTSEYAYFSSTSSSWVKHAKTYSHNVISEFGLNNQSQVIEIASNDGYLLKNFVKAKIPCLGIEPTDSTAEAAEQLGIPVLREFFGEKLGEKLALEGKYADLIVGNNVYAHVPNINDFTKGLKAVLKPEGTITLEFPHLMRLIDKCQFDTVYHEHFSYLSLFTVVQIFDAFELRVWNVEELSTHGGSLRVYGCHKANTRATKKTVSKLLIEESKRGLQDIKTYLKLQKDAEKIKDDLIEFLIKQKRRGKKVAGYGAAAKGNTMLNFAGIKKDLLEYVCDASKAKQNKYLPGSHIPIEEPNTLYDKKPDYVLILPWNIATEVINQNNAVFDWGGKFVTLIPNLEVIK